jgi:hypothetical protein
MIAFSCRHSWITVYRGRIYTSSMNAGSILQYQPLLTSAVVMGHIFCQTCLLVHGILDRLNAITSWFFSPITQLVWHWISTSWTTFRAPNGCISPARLTQRHFTLQASHGDQHPQLSSHCTYHSELGGAIRHHLCGGRYMCTTHLIKNIHITKTYTSLSAAMTKRLSGKHLAAPIPSHFR